MWPKKENDNGQLLILWPNQECVVTFLLLTSTPLITTTQRCLIFQLGCALEKVTKAVAGA